MVGLMSPNTGRSMRRRRFGLGVGRFRGENSRSAPTRIAYRIDAHDIIVETDGDWDAAATANDAPELCDLGSVDLLATIRDPTLQELWRLILRDVRSSQRPHEFAVRCDAPTMRRWTTLVVEPQPEGAVSFSSVETKTETRPYVRVLDRRAPRNDELLDLCAWCGQARLSDWVTVEEAVEQLGLFEQRTMPSISHGICDRCLARGMDELGGASPSPGASVG